jgi:hypothetical protein
LSGLLSATVHRRSRRAGTQKAEIAVALCSASLDHPAMIRVPSGALVGLVLCLALPALGCAADVSSDDEHNEHGDGGHAPAAPVADGSGGEAATSGGGAGGSASSGASIGPSGTTRVLARHQASPLAIAVDATHVYWTTSRDVMKCAIGGCNLHPTAIATRQAGIDGLAIDATDAYWITLAGEVKKCALAGCLRPTLLASGLKTPASIAVKDGFVYWTNTDNNEAVSHGSVMKCATSGCGGAPTVLAANQDEPVGIVVDDASVYWSNNSGTGDIVKCGREGCSGQPITIATGQYNVESIVLAAEGLAWLTMGSNQDGGTIATHARDPGGAPTTIAAKQAPSFLASAGTALYWTSIGLDYQLGMVVTCPTSACPSGPAALVPHKRLAGPIAVDATHVYWSDFAKGGAAQGVILQTAR